MIFKITYKYDLIPMEFYFETKLMKNDISDILKKWFFYVYEEDINFCFDSENISIILNTYDEINFCKSDGIDPYEIECFELFSYEDGCESVDLNFTEEDNLRKIIINKMIKDFYIGNSEVRL